MHNIRLWNAKKRKMLFKFYMNVNHYESTHVTAPTKMLLSKKLISFEALKEESLLFRANHQRFAFRIIETIHRL